MHIPDGYLSPESAAAMYAAALPFWYVASRKVKQVLTSKMVPLLSIFAAFSFTIMMFNVPVPGGTTAHAVGGTLMAIVLGPWTAVIGVSVALAIQAIFFGDGGITAFGANAFNMAIVLPLVGYAVYRVLSAHAAVRSTRRAWAAAIGSYVGITAAAVLVGVELGVQPLFWRLPNGQALYSPYSLQQAVPAMLVAHALGASLVEALVTGLGVAYLQRARPELLGAVETAGEPPVTSVTTHQTT
jgi:cobalt/nickel transport system permease protein